MQFHDLQAKLLENFELLSTALGGAYQTDADKDDLWSTYLESFPEERNPIFRVRREYDCSCCRSFIRNIGGIVFINLELELKTIWGFEIDDPDYQAVLDAMDAYVKSRAITGVYLVRDSSVGTKQNFESDDQGNVTKWEHFFLPLPNQMRYKGGGSLETVRSSYRDTAHVFERSLSEISMDAIDTVMDLISSNTLYKGAEWKSAIVELRKHKVKYDGLPAQKKSLYAWAQSWKVGPVIGRIRNHSIGVLLTDISNGADLNEAVTRYERIVAPANYKRPKAIFTAKMLENAKQTITELGYLNSLQRRYARLDDITVNNILFSNRDAARRIKGDVFSEMMAEAKSSPKRFDRVEEIPAERFIADVLPGATEIEAFVENRHAPNMVSLIAPVDPEAPSMFKWGNPFSWAYSGNITDSGIRENVKNAGGSVDGVLRFSIQWNDGTEWSQNDLDAHCTEPEGGTHIFFGQKHSARTGGQLDVDITHPSNGVPAVENITWPAKNRMLPGNYEFCVHQYANRGGRDGFRAEIAFDGQVFQFDYQKELRQDEVVKVAAVNLSSDGMFTIKEYLPSSTASRELWGVKTMGFTPVTVVMFSPNYWDKQDGIGNKHYMFMLKDCVNPEKPNGFYNEFLKQELAEHKRVFEALGGKMAVEFVEDQLSGLGFSSTLRNELVVKVKGATERVMKIKF